MLTEVTIQGYRCFTEFRLHGLARLNLLVGKNNSGKTAALEAIQLLAGGGHPSYLLNILGRREEYVPAPDPAAESSDISLSVAPLFHGHDISLGRFFEISGSNTARTFFRCEVVAPPETKGEEGALPSALTEAPALGLGLSSDQLLSPAFVRLGANGGLPTGAFRRAEFQESTRNVTFVSTDSMTSYTMSRIWNDIALTPAESQVVAALQILDPRVERVAFLSMESGRFARTRGGIVLKLKETNYRVALGSMGDGMRRILALSLAIIRSRNGVVLIDEIDTGFHYSIMPAMWKLVASLAQRLSVQVFATTHSWDCLRGLASYVEADSQHGTDVSVMRIERDQDLAVHYSGDELTLAAKSFSEMR